MNSWNSTKRFFEYLGMFFVGVVIPAAATAYIFVVRPALAVMEEPREYLVQTMTVSRYHNDLVAGSAGALNDLVDHLRDSVSREHSFATDLPEGSILLQLAGDSTAVIIQFNLDCECPMESNRFDALCFSVDWIMGEPAATQSISHKGIPRYMSQIDIHSTAVLYDQEDGGKEVLHH